MENFVLYDELGRGEQRIVYKGRKKGTIEYLAIHCVEKSKREELQNSVRICHDLLHKNIVQFHEWYETSNHLWLVVELCTGLNLETILMQDGFLPEKTIKGFGRDIIEALFYLHCRDIIYCDLVPSKVVLDGTGILKLSNFTLAKFEGESDHLDEEQADIDVDNSILERESLSKRIVNSSPFYIAPEVLTGDFHTKLSDFWSLGCLLYECFTGRPPYVVTQFDELLQKIQSEDIQSPVQEKDGSITHSSECFHSLVEGLLAKDPLQRIGWYDLCSHDFWEGSLLHIVEEIKKMSSSYDDLNTSSNEPNTSKSDFSKANVSSNQNKQFESENGDERAGKGTLLLQGLDHLEGHKDSSDKGNLKQDRQTHCSTATFLTTEKSKYSSLRKSKKMADLDASIKQSQPQLIKSNFVLEEVGDFGLNLNLVDLLYHPSDLEVSPIIDNPKIQKQTALKWDVHHIPFPTLKAESIDQLSHEEIESHILTISEFFEHLVNGSKGSGGVALRAKTHSLNYLCSLSKFDKIANSLIEKDFIRLLVNELKGPGSQDLKIRVGKLLGTLACSATYISSDFKMTEVLTALTEVLRDNLCVAPLKVALLPALGEFMFYAATQEEGEDKKISNWDPPGAMFTIVSRCLQPGEDVLVQHLAAKIVENIVTTAGRYCKKFLTKDIALSLWNLFSHSVTDAEKVTSSSALCRLSMHSNALILQVMEKIGVDSLCKALFTGTNNIQQSLLTVIITLLSNPTYFKRISQDTNAIHKTIRILESSSLTLRGKVYLFIAEISTKSYDALIECLRAKIVFFIERDSKKSSSAHARTDIQAFSYAKKCLELAVGNILKQVPIIMSGLLKAMDAVVGRHHPSTAQIKQLRANIPYLSILLHIVTSQVFRPRIINDTFIEALGSLLNFIQIVDTGQTNLASSLGGHTSEDIMRTVFSIVEAIAQHPLLLLQYREVFISNILPHLSSFCCSSSGDNRMWATKMFSDVATLYFENDDCDKSSRGRTTDGGKLLEIINDTIVQNIDAFLQDQDPIPAYSLKLLQSYVDHNKDSAKYFIEKDIVIKVLELFERHQDNTRSSTLLAIINFIASVMSACSKDVALICQQELIDYLVSAFIAASAVLEEDETGENASLLFLPLLDTLRHILRSLESQVKRVVRSKEDVGKVRNERNQDVYNVEQLLQRCKILSELNGVLITLLCFDDEDVQEWSTHCLYISAELFGGEYEASFSEDNLECLIDAIQLSNDKRKKLLLRIIKRFVTSNDTLLRILQENGDDLRRYLTEFVAADCTSTEMKAVQVAAHEVLRLMKNN